MELVDCYAQRWVKDCMDEHNEQKNPLEQFSGDSNRVGESIGIGRTRLDAKIKDLVSCPKYSMAFSQKLLPEQNALITEVNFLANNKPIHIVERQMRRLLFRVINHGNAARRLGVFLVDPLTGLLRFRQTSLTIGLSIPETNRLAEDTRSQLYQPLENNLLKILQCCGFHNTIMEVSGDDQRKKLEEVKRLTLIKRCVEVSNVRFPREAVENKRSASRRNPIPENQQPLDPQLEELSPFLDSFQKYFTQPAVSTSIHQAQPTNIYSNITIKNPEQVEWQLLKQTNLSLIERAKVTFNFSVNKLKEFTKILVRKTETDNYTGRVQREQELLEGLRDCSSPNFVRTFTDGTEDALYTEMSPTGTYHGYFRNNTECASLLTKLYSLAQVLQGMRFLQENKITHMDLKPQNILIGRNLTMKLTDLGQAYHPKHKDYQPGTSMPYSSPEAYQYDATSSNQITSKSDVYSFGVMLMNDLFAMQPLTVSPSSSEVLAEDFTNGTYHQRLIVNPISNSQFGPQPVMETLYSLGIRCFDPNPNNRPEIEWMLVVLREALAHLQKLY